MKEKTKFLVEIVLNSVFIVVSIFVVILSKNYTGFSSTNLGAKTFPQLIAIILSCFAVVNIVNASMKLYHILKTEQIKFDSEEIIHTTARGIKALLVEYRTATAIIICFLYYLGLTFVGFIISTLLFLPAMLILLEYRMKIKILLITVISTGLIYICFRILLNVPLPIGLLFE